MYLAGTFDTLALNWTQMQFYAIKGSKEKRNRNYKYLLDWYYTISHINLAGAFDSLLLYAVLCYFPA